MHISFHILLLYKFPAQASLMVDSASRSRVPNYSYLMVELDGLWAFSSRKGDVGLELCCKFKSRTQDLCQVHTYHSNVRPIPGFYSETGTDRELACVAGPQFYGGPDLQRAGFWRARGKIEDLQESPPFMTTRPNHNLINSY